MLRRLSSIAVTLTLAATVLGCAAPSAESDHAAVRTIQQLLELRREDSRDPKAYAPFFLESSLATALAEASEEDTGTPQIPEWETPYLSEETTDTASVVVVWRPDTAFPDWPKVNIFSLSYLEEQWVVIDAVEATAAPTPLSTKGSDAK